MYGRIALVLHADEGIEEGVSLTRSGKECGTKQFFHYHQKFYKNHNSMCSWFILVPVPIDSVLWSKEHDYIWIEVISGVYPGHIHI